MQRFIFLYFKNSTNAIKQGPSFACSCCHLIKGVEKTADEIRGAQLNHLSRPWLNPSTAYKKQKTKKLR